MGAPGIVRLNSENDRVRTIDNLKIVCMATHNAHNTYKKLPPASGTYGQSTGNHSMSVHLLPFVEQMPLYQTGVMGNPMPTTALIPAYNSPLDPSTSDWVRVQNFACNLRVFTDVGFVAYDANTGGYINIDETMIAAVIGSKAPGGAR